jgi:hypothetical protein
MCRIMKGVYNWRRLITLIIKKYLSFMKEGLADWQRYAII